VPRVTTGAMAAVAAMGPRPSAPKEKTRGTGAPRVKFPARKRVDSHEVRPRSFMTGSMLAAGRATGVDPGQESSGCTPSPPEGERVGEREVVSYGGDIAAAATLSPNPSPASGRGEKTDDVRVFPLCLPRLRRTPSPPQGERVGEREVVSIHSGITRAACPLPRPVPQAGEGDPNRTVRLQECRRLPTSRDHCARAAAPVLP